MGFEVKWECFLSIVQNKTGGAAAASRRSVIFQNQSGSAQSIEDNEEIRECLKIFSENVRTNDEWIILKYFVFHTILYSHSSFQKITKKNAWSLNLIDSFSALVSSHHKKLKNFQIVGSTLEGGGHILFALECRQVLYFWYIFYSSFIEDIRIAGGCCSHWMSSTGIWSRPHKRR